MLAWAELHQEELLENWRLARAGETLQEIVAVVRHGTLCLTFSDGLEVDVLERMHGPSFPKPGPAGFERVCIDAET